MKKKLRSFNELPKQELIKIKGGRSATKDPGKIPPDFLDP